MNKNNLVKKSESLTLAKYKLSELSIKILSTVVSMIRKDDKDFQVYRLKISDFSSLIDSKRKSIYDEIKKISKELMKKPIEIALNDNEILIVNWIASAKYIKNGGVLDIQIAPDLKPYLIELSGGFLKYELKNILALKSPYIIRLYELLKHEYNKVNNYTGNEVVSYEIEINILRDIFQIPNSYQYSSGIKLRILDRAINQFKEKTDIKIEYKEHKRGKKVFKLEFTIRENKKETKPYLKSERIFINYMRKFYIKSEIFVNKNMILSISPEGRLYDIISLKEFNRYEAKELWSKIYGMSLKNKLIIIPNSNNF